MSEWISVEDQMPTEGQDVLCCFSRGFAGVGFLVAGRFEGYGEAGELIGWASCETEESVRVKITHWTPIPPPPSKQRLHPSTSGGIIKPA